MRLFFLLQTEIAYWASYLCLTIAGLIVAALVFLILVSVRGVKALLSSLATLLLPLIAGRQEDLLPRISIKEI